MADESKGTDAAKDERAFDIEEFRAIREEILLRVDATFKLEVVAVTGASAVYAWLATRGGLVDILLWFFPPVISALAWLRAETLGHQAYQAGNYLQLIEKRERHTPLPNVPGQSVDYRVHGWEGYIRLPSVRKWYVDHVSRIFWSVVVAASTFLAVRAWWRG